MDTLSVEMFEAIFGYITEPADLLSLRAVNRLFHARFTPPAFQVMRFRRTTQNNIRLRKLVSTGLARWVTDVTFDVNMSVRVNNLVTPSTLLKWPKALNRAVFERCAKAFSAAAAFINVRSVSLNFHRSFFRGNQFRCARRLELQLLFITSLTVRLGAMDPSSLTITNFRPIIHGYFAGPAFQRFLGGLSHFSIAFCRDFRSDSFSSNPFFGKFAETWLKPMQGSLKTLILGNTSGEIIPAFPMQHAALVFRNLKRLELGRFQFARHHTPDIEAFIVSDPVASTLEHLVLGACCIHDVAESTGELGWAITFKKFETGLKKLKNFEISAPLTYGWSRTIVDEDKKALNDLWVSIGQLDKVSPIFPDIPDLGGEVLDHLMEDFDFDAFFNEDDVEHFESGILGLLNFD